MEDSEQCRQHSRDGDDGDDGTKDRGRRDNDGAGAGLQPSDTEVPSLKGPWKVTWAIQLL